jgi:hypothetical protein
MKNANNVIVILSCFRYSFNFLHRQNSTEKNCLGLNRKVVADRAGTNVRK